MGRRLAQHMYMGASHIHPPQFLYRRILRTSDALLILSHELQVAFGGGMVGLFSWTSQLYLIA